MRYRVFSPTAAPIEFPEGVLVEESYPAFSIVSASEEVIAELRKRYPVEKLDRPGPAGVASRMAAARPAASGRARGGRRDVVVRFRAPVRPEWLASIAEMGAEVKRPLGDAAVVASLRDAKGLARVRGFDKVETVEDLVPEVRVSPDFVRNLVGEADEGQLFRAAARLASGEVPPPPAGATSVPNMIVATFLTERDRASARDKLSKSRSGEIYDGGDLRLVINLGAAADPEASLSALVAMAGLVRVEEKALPKLHNSVARMTIGRGVVSSNPSGLGLTGKGEVACVADTGLDTGDLKTLHADLHGRVRDLTSFPIAASWNSLVSNPGGDDGPGDLYSGHGTHISGSVLGNGARSTALGLDPVVGMAPESRLVFQSIEQTPKWTPAAKLSFLQQGIKPPASGLYGIPDDLGSLFQAAYDLGARVHSNSWGGGPAGEYNSQAEAVDRFVWEHPDFLILFAVGNDGKAEAVGGTAVAPGSISPPATAKNCLTVGACENDRPSEFTATYGQWWPHDFPDGDIAVDNMTDSADDIAAFSSRGPCSSGRRKPDLVAPGTFVLSTRSSRMPANNFGWAAFPAAKDDYMFDGGTSMATPLVAGAALLVRQYLRRTAGIKRPTAALLKAALIHSAHYTRYRLAHASSGPFADNEQGWGRVCLRNVLAPDAPTRVFFLDEKATLTTGQSSPFEIAVGSGAAPLRVTLVYTDYPGASLVNNLNLIVTDPTGRFFLGNDFGGAGLPDSRNNVEAVLISSPTVGTWTVNVIASEVQQGPQRFALVISGADVNLDRTTPAGRRAVSGRKATRRRRGT